MKRKYVAVGIILLFVAIAYAPAIAQTTEKQSVSRGTWLYVGGSGPGNYSRIQDAIDNASNGDTVFVFSGSYYEHVIVNKSITLIGENQESTIIDGNHTGNVMKIFANRVTLTGFTIQNSGNSMYNDKGLYIHSDNNTIIDCIISNNFRGIALEYAHGNLVSDNYVHHNNDGILIFGYTSWNRIVNNTFTYNDVTGISMGGDFIHYDRYETIADNVITKNSYGIDTAGTTDSLIIRNTITDNSYNGMDLDDTINCVISWNLIRNHGKWGILSEFSSNNTFQHNTLIKAGYGLAYYTNHGTPDTWYQNYWGRSRILPKLIFGNRMFNEDDDDHAFCLPWVMIDWHPAQEPYDIPGMS
ncbi:MAG: right-handed parallel beta-helix repeat-containing protein [Candidatus Thermoplasmatota archaeon]|nr:right-handed parallel beta-helix repeat-containing protein [Candidatus Thermoplasmatota archaeon]